jgi:hypothetical protein
MSPVTRSCDSTARDHIEVLPALDEDQSLSGAGAGKWVGIEATLAG